MPFFIFDTTDFCEVSDVAAQLDGDIDDVHHHIKVVQTFLEDHNGGGLTLFEPYIDALNSIRWLENYFKIT